MLHDSQVFRLNMSGVLRKRNFKNTCFWRKLLTSWKMYRETNELKHHYPGSDIYQKCFEGGPTSRGLCYQLWDEAQDLCGLLPVYAPCSVAVLLHKIYHSTFCLLFVRTKKWTPFKNFSQTPPHQLFSKKKQSTTISKIYDALS